MLLSFEDVNLVYEIGKERNCVLQDINLTVEPGEFITIVGPSGCGKSSLLKLAAGVIPPSTGEIRFQNKPIDSINLKTGIMFQEPNLFPWLTVRQNIEFGPKRKGSSREIRDAMTELYLEQMGLTEFGNYKPYELSGGMKQRVALARTLINDPELLLMDEPLGALDKLIKDNMQVVFKNLWLKTGKTFLFVTHDVEEAVKLGTRIVVMSPRPGKILNHIHNQQELSPDGSYDEGRRKDIINLIYRLLVDSSVWG